MSITVFRRYFQPALLSAFIILASCERELTRVESDPLIYNPDWTFASHGNADQDYSTVFPRDSVNTIEISMTSSQWNSIRSNMKSLIGFDFGGKAAGGGGSPGEEPEYVDVGVEFNGKAWKNVGFRLKGNSSLSQIWGAGIYKLPFKLDFDEFEDSYEAIQDQRFYGFNKLSFSPGFKDQSLMREKITPDIFRMAGIPAAQTAFYRVYIDFGPGLKYCGVYTAVEYPDDNMIRKQWGEEEGNIYKPESKLGSFNLSEFNKKNNEPEADYSDIQAFINILNSNLRKTEADQWRSDLESVFDVGHFIKYLAVNNAVVNWDSYGVMAHNYYLYNHSINGLIWIPWDHNEALEGSPGITGTGTPGRPGGNGGRNPLSLSMNEVSDAWPLLRYIADDAVYFAKYLEYLKWFNEEVFSESEINGLLDKYYAMITPYVTGEYGEKDGYTHLTGSDSYDLAFAALKEHVPARKALISDYVP